jgi:hypothetical protein
MTEDDAATGRSRIAPLDEIVERNQVWSAMAAKWGVENPVPPWKTSLDGMCDALARADLPYPENQLVSLAHSLMARGVIDEAELRQRLASIRERLEA